ncbi:MAG: hypothetical protein GX625_09740 [Clostridiaceae bacterium]|nr:hypothetical protein [Clostridiaceae bacterium]
MGKLKDSSRNKETRTLSIDLWNALQDVDENYADSFLAWCNEKIKINKLHEQELSIKIQLKNKSLPEQQRSNLEAILHNVKHKNHPLNITKGDIVHVRFGVNVGDELSDLDSQLKLLRGHYGIVIAQKGFMFLILPLTSHPSRLNDPDLDFYFEGFDLPGECNKSYLAFAKMQFVHFRRINRIHGISEGKKYLSTEQMNKVNFALNKLLQINDNNIKKNGENS